MNCKTYCPSDRHLDWHYATQRIPPLPQLIHLSCPFCRPERARCPFCHLISCLRGPTRPLWSCRSGLDRGEDGGGLQLEGRGVAPPNSPSPPSRFRDKSESTLKSNIYQDEKKIIGLEAIVSRGRQFPFQTRNQHYFLNFKSRCFFMHNSNYPLVPSKYAPAIEKRLFHL